MRGKVSSIVSGIVLVLVPVPYNLSRSNEPPSIVPKRKFCPEEERLGGSEHQPSFILFIMKDLCIQHLHSIRRYGISLECPASLALWFEKT